MLFTSYTLPQLAVSAKLLCLLMVSQLVVICGAVPSMVRSVRLYNDCSSSDVSIDPKGRVLANDNKSDRFQNLTIRSIGFSGEVQIQGDESKLFLCFNKRWKLVGRPKSKKTEGPMCQFNESMTENAYNRYRSLANESFYVGFNRKGRPLKAALAGTLGPREKCLNFLKRENQEFSINEHNNKLAGGNQSSEQAPTQKRPHKTNKHTKGQSKPTKSPPIRHRNHRQHLGKQS